MFLPITIESWDVARQLSRKLIGWVFRGQADSTWPLSTTLERRADQYNCLPALRRNRENWILRDFQRRAHHYIPDPPPLDRKLEWTALLQHHGGPTRLLDFTYSFYVAAFFAMEASSTDAAVWAVNLNKLEEGLCTLTKRPPKRETRDIILERNIALAETLLASGSGQFVLHVEPHRMNERMSTQQGTFLLSADIACSFTSNLIATLGAGEDEFQAPPKSASDLSFLDLNAQACVKVMLPRGRHASALADLWKMNVHAGSLFPGLDGFARSLQHHLRIFDRNDEAHEILGF
jgi:hypothetical protein